MNIQRIQNFIINHKKWLIIAGSVALLVTVIIVLIGLSRQQMSSNAPVSVKTHQREGFQELAGSVADPAAVIGNGYEKPITYGGSVIVDACNLLPLDQLNREKVRLYPNPTNSTHERYYISGDGNGDIPKNGIALSNNINQCEYIFNDRNSVAISIWQPAYLETRYLKYDLVKYAPAESAHTGVTHKTQTKAGGNVSHLLQKDDVYAEFSFISAANKDKAALESLTNKVMPYIMQNFANQVSKPSGVPKCTYDSPTFIKSVATACSLINADGFQKVFKVQPSPVVYEKITSTVGLITGYEDTGNDYFHYIHNECERRTGDSSYRSEQKRIRVVVTSYEDARGTKAAFDFDKQGDKGTTTSRTYGNDSYVVTAPTKADPGTVIIRKDRFLLKLTMSDPAHESSKTDPQYFVGQLDPAIDDILSRLPQS